MKYVEFFMKNIWKYGRTYYTWRAGCFNTKSAKRRNKNDNTDSKGNWLIANHQRKTLTEMMKSKELDSETRALIRDSLYNGLTWNQAKDLIKEIENILNNGKNFSKKEEL